MRYGYGFGFGVRYRFSMISAADNLFTTYQARVVADSGVITNTTAVGRTYLYV
jgi:hypothetical protein